MSDPQWSAELTLTDNVTGARREVRVDGPLLAHVIEDVYSAVRHMVVAEAARMMATAVKMTEDAEKGQSGA